MMEWKEVRLDSLVNRKICYGIVQPGISPESGIPVIKVNNIVKGLRDVSECDKTTEEINNKYKRTILKGGELVISLVGTVGYVDIVPLSFAGANLVRATGMIDIEDELIKRWVLFYIRTKQGQQYIEKNLNTTVQRALNIKDLCKMPIPITQRCYMEKVVSILSSLDDKIAVNKKICENLEAQAQALFKHWFVDFAPFKDGKFVESELGLIPEGWRVGTLSDLGEIVGGATPSKAESSYFTDKGIPWLTPKDLSNDLKKFTSRGEIDITEDGYNSCSAKIMPRGSVLFSSRAPIGYLTIAKNSICTNQGFKSVVPKYAGTAYIYYLLKLNTKRIESMSTGTTFKEASGALMKSLAVVLPPKSILDAFESKVLDIFNEQEILETESHRLASLRDTLLPKLMSGEIEI